MLRQNRLNIHSLPFPIRGCACRRANRVPLITITNGTCFNRYTPSLRYYNESKLIVNPYEEKLRPRRSLTSQGSPSQKDSPSKNDSLAGFSAIVGNMHKRIPKKEWHLTDLVSVLGIGILFVSILILPSVIEQMRQSSKTYDEWEVEDAIRHEMENVSQEIHEDLIQLLERSNIINSEDIKRSGTTIDIIKEVVYSDALRNTIASLVSRIITSTQFQDACKNLVRNLWNDLLHDPETTTQLVQVLNNALNNEIIKRSFKALVLKILQDEDVYNELTRLVVRLSEDQAVLDATKDLLAESAHRTLNDPDILDHSMEFATDVVGDDGVQRTSGEALRHTVTYALRPSLSVFLSIIGFGLVALSMTALGKAHFSAQEGKAIGAAADILVRNYMDTGITKILSIATNLLRIGMTPLRILGRWSFTVYETSLQTSQRIWTVLSTVLFMPISLFRGFSSLIHNSFTNIISISSAIWGDIVYIASMPIWIFRQIQFLASAVGVKASIYKRTIHYLLFEAVVKLGSLPSQIKELFIGGYGYASFTIYTWRRPEFPYKFTDVATVAGYVSSFLLDLGTAFSNL